MTGRGWTAVGVGVICLLGVAAAARAETPEEVFDRLYGAEVRSAMMTRAGHVIGPTAKRLLEAARSSASSTELRVLLLEHAASIGGRAPTGYETAVAALVLLRETKPERTVETLEEQLDLETRLFKAARGAAWNAAGENLVTTLLALADAALEETLFAKAAGYARRAADTAEKVRSTRTSEVGRRLERVELAKRLAELEAALAARPADRPIREQILRFYLVEYDDPERAAAFAERDSEDHLDKYILVAAMKPTTLPERACIELADWYGGLAQEAGAVGRPAMLRRARTYYRRFLELHTAEDLERDKATLALAEVEKALADLAKPEAPKAEWVDLLALVNPGRHTLNGNWVLRGGVLAVQSRPGAYLAVPALPEGSYELRVTFKRLRGHGRGLAITLPIGRTGCVLRLAGRPSGGSYSGANEYGLTSGLETVNGADFTTSPGHVSSPKMPNGTEHTVLVKVDLKAPDAAITVTYNGQPYLSWEGAASDLAMPDVGTKRPPPRSFGLGCDAATAGFSELKVRMLTGQLKRF